MNTPFPDSNAILSSMLEGAKAEVKAKGKGWARVDQVEFGHGEGVALARLNRFEHEANEAIRRAQPLRKAA